MGTILASALISQARTVLEDTSSVRWSDAELLGWLNNAQREVVEMRLSAGSKIATRQLAAGTKQTLPTDAIQLLDVVRNMGKDGSSPGLPVRQTTRQLLDAQVPGWHYEGTTTEIEHYVYDPQVPKVFWVYPVSDGQGWVELQYAAVPADVPNLNSAITLDDQYANAILDGILYRAYAKDTEHEGNEQRALAFRASMADRLEVKAQTDAATTAVNSAQKR